VEEAAPRLPPLVAVVVQAVQAERLMAERDRLQRSPAVLLPGQAAAEVLQAALVAAAAAVMLALAQPLREAGLQTLEVVVEAAE
tara:strand:- start:71 stop:322 length:252 start_codon:yes stop_codon:yes gene_type:complete